MVSFQLLSINNFIQLETKLVVLNNGKYQLYFWEIAYNNKVAQIDIISYAPPQMLGQEEQ